MVEAHVDHLASQLARIVQDGVSEGAFTSADPQGPVEPCCRPRHCSTTPPTRTSGGIPALPDQLEAVLDLLLEGLRPR